jgi:asparagine synthase (glutamine-hydrolysing)
MCGVAGVWGSADETLVREILRRTSHRGPDGSGVYCDLKGQSALGHRRLAIVDPQGGAQPIRSDDPRVAAVVNGEVYNHADLRRSLGEARFRTDSDSESILQLYIEDGRQAPPSLDGMYAFVLQDGDHLYAARDPLGIKPLYMGKRSSGWCFASEIKGLVGLADEIQEFPAGTAFHTARGFEKFYCVPEVSATYLAEQEALAKLRETFERTVVKRLMSDVPLGVLLSGGLDSSLVAAVARRHIEPLHTFAVGVVGSEDLEAARQVASYLDTVHHEHVLTPDEITLHLPRILYHLESFDQDLVQSAIPCYFAARLAAEHVKVILTGEGADELFAGYRYHKSYLDADALARELRRSVRSLHNINLQRLDRMTMAHGIEGRVPFLDTELVSLAQRIAPGLKLRARGRARVVEKWVLRAACTDLLPPEILWREKKQFDEGSGATGLLPLALEDWATALDADDYARSRPGASLRSPEECVYHALLTSAFPDPDPVLRSVARWSHRPVESGSDGASGEH